MAQAQACAGGYEGEDRQLSDEMSLEVKTLGAVCPNQHSHTIMFKAQSLHQDLQEKDQEIEKWKNAYEEALKKPNKLKHKLTKATPKEFGVIETACLYAFTINAYLDSSLLQIPLSKTWDSEKRWDEDFVEEGHLHEFQDWLKLPETIWDQISVHSVQWRVCDLLPYATTALSYQEQIDSTIGEVWCHLKHQIKEDIKKIFSFLEHKKGHLWECEEAKQL